MLRYAVLALPLTLAACGPNGATNISIHDSDGDVNVSSDGNGVASIKLPPITVSAADFEVNGVKLYPGSTLKGLDVKANAQDSEKDGRVATSFDSPASLARVQAWFRDAMAKHGFKVSQQGNGFAGTTDDGQPVTVELEADGPDKTKGSMTVGA
jgi:hypothetical protein